MYTLTLTQHDRFPGIQWHHQTPKHRPLCPLIGSDPDFGPPKSEAHGLFRTDRVSADNPEAAPYGNEGKRNIQGALIGRAEISLNTPGSDQDAGRVQDHIHSHQTQPESQGSFLLWIQGNHTNTASYKLSFLCCLKLYIYLVWYIFLFRKKWSNVYLYWKYKMYVIWSFLVILSVETVHILNSEMMFRVW